MLRAAAFREVERSGARRRTRRVHRMGNADDQWLCSRRIGLKNALSTLPELMYQPSLPPLAGGEYRVVEKPVVKSSSTWAVSNIRLYGQTATRALGVARSL